MGEVMWKGDFVEVVFGRYNLRIDFVSAFPAGTPIHLMSREALSAQQTFAECLQCKSSTKPGPHIYIFT